jgi:hypothetical protein
MKDTGEKKRKVTFLLTVFSFFTLLELFTQSDKQRKKGRFSRCLSDWVKSLLSHLHMDEISMDESNKP